MKRFFFLFALTIGALCPLSSSWADSPYGDSDLVAPPVPGDIPDVYRYDTNSSMALSDVSLENSLTNSSLNNIATYDVAGSSNECYGCDWPILRWFEHSQAGFDNFISPTSNPIFFEDPRTLTEARFLYINHQIPNNLGGGDVQVYAMQVRAALNDRLSIVAAKDGIIIGQPNAPHDDGAANISVGLKYNLFSDPVSQRLLSAGISYELPVGSQQAWQGIGDGEFNFYLTGGAEFWCDWHWLSAMGYRLPTDNVDQVQVFYWSNHIDRRLTNCWYGFGEVNWYEYLSSASGGGFAGFNGMDLYNLGATNVANTGVVTGAIGLKYKPSKCVEIGLAWEWPLTRNRDVMEDRFTLDWILRY